MAERRHDGAGERGDVDDDGGLVPARVRERIAKNEAAFRVGVEDFHRLPRHGRHHVARLDRVAAGMFSVAGTMPTMFSGSFMSAAARMAPKTLAAPHMSNFISSISSAGLMD
jgi:hypothetical protein